MKRAVVLWGICASALGVACQQRADDVRTTQNEARGAENAADELAARREADKPVAADNAGKNERDRNGNLPTPIDQGNGERELEVTRQIREQVVAHPNFSVNAQNVKIITQNGSVTLRGPVDSSDEKAAIERIARGAAGNLNVVNELEVKTEVKNGQE
jgi:hyperosmotically inducible protein